MSKPRKSSRRTFLKSSVATALAFPMINFGTYHAHANDPKTYSGRAIELVNSDIVIDMLGILPALKTMMQGLTGANPKTSDLFEVDDETLAKIKASGIDVWHSAVGIADRNAVLQAFARSNAYAAERPGTMFRIDSIADLDDVRDKDRIGFIIGNQDSSHFEDVDDVNLFYNLGQRVSQLTYNSQNLIGSGATERVDGGISHFGAGIVERMNAVGMAVDVSHSGDQTTLDAFDISTKPVLITHSNCRSLVPGHPRCKPDNVIEAMAKTGGVMGITGVRNFVRDKEPTTIEHMLDHYDHVARLVGVEHVGIGSDIDSDGYDDMPAEQSEALRSGYRDSYGFRDKLDTDGFDHPLRVYDLAEGLIRRGYSDADIGLVLGGNFRRALDDIWSGTA